MCRIDPAQGAERASRRPVSWRANAMSVLKRNAPALSRYGPCKMDLSVLQRLRRKALMSR
jgi:hypothetical protein